MTPEKAVTGDAIKTCCVSSTNYNATCRRSPVLPTNLNMLHFMILPLVALILVIRMNFQFVGDLVIVLLWMCYDGGFDKFQSPICLRL